jgi:hypothetical protein
MSESAIWAIFWAFVVFIVAATSCVDGRGRTFLTTVNDAISDDTRPIEPRP